MKRVLLVLLGLLLFVGVRAQEIKSPEALAIAVSSAITSGDGKAMQDLIDPGTRPDTKSLVVKDCMAYRRADHFSVELMKAEDKTWTGPPLKKLIENIKKQGFEFPARPLGRIRVSGKRIGHKKNSKFDAFYGKFGKNYLLIFAARNK